LPDPEGTSHGPSRHLEGSKTAGAFSNFSGTCFQLLSKEAAKMARGDEGLPVPWLYARQ